MLTPFNEDRSIDWWGVDALAEWYIYTKVSGLFACSRSGEVDELMDDERVDLVKRVVCRSDGRLPVVACGGFGDTLDERVESIKRIADTGVAAVILVANRLVDEQADEFEWLTAVESLLEKTGQIPLGISESEYPYYRTVSPRILSELAESGRFYFLQENSHDSDVALAKMRAVYGSPLQIYHANIPSLFDTLLGGVHGTSATAINFYPHLLVWLCDRFNNDAVRARSVHDFLCAFDPLLHLKYPMSAKMYLNRFWGLPIGVTTRRETRNFSTEDMRRLKGLSGAVEHLQRQIKLNDELIWLSR